MAATLKIEECACLESLAYLGATWEYPDRHLLSVSAVQLHSLLMLVYGHRALESHLSRYECSNAETPKNVALPLTAPQIRIALKLIKWLRRGGGDTALVLRKETLPSLEQSLTQSLPENPALRAAPQLQSPSRTIQLSQDQIIELLHAIRTPLLRSETPTGLLHLTDLASRCTRNTRRSATIHFRFMMEIAKSAMNRRSTSLAARPHAWL